jgi:hypothetical protein
MLLPIFAVLVAPCLAVFASTFEIVPALCERSLQSGRCSGRAGRSPAPGRWPMPGRSAGSWEARSASAPPMAPPAAAPPAIPRKFPTSLLVGRWAGLVSGRCAVPVSGLLGSCEARSETPPALLGSCDGRSAPPGRVAGFEGRCAALAPPETPGLVGRSEGRCVLLGRLLDGSCDALPRETVDPVPPEGRFAGVVGTRPPLGRDAPPEGNCEGRETLPPDGRE